MEKVPLPQVTIIRLTLQGVSSELLFKTAKPFTCLKSNSTGEAVALGGYGKHATSLTPKEEGRNVGEYF